MTEDLNGMHNNPGKNQEKLSVRVEIAAPKDWIIYKELRILALSGKDGRMFGATPEKIAAANARTDEEWQEDLSLDDEFIVLSWCDDEPAGMGGAFKKEEGYWRMNSGYVKEKFRGEGLQNRMIALRLKEIQRQGGVRVVTGVEIGNKISMRNCKSFGFLSKDPPDIELFNGDQFLQIEIPDLNDPVIIKRIEEVLNK